MNALSIVNTAPDPGRSTPEGKATITLSAEGRAFYLFSNDWRFAPMVEGSVLEPFPHFPFLAFEIRER